MERRFGEEGGARARRRGSPLLYVVYLSARFCFIKWFRPIGPVYFFFCPVQNLVSLKINEKILEG